MEQVVQKFPQVLCLTVENMKEHVEFLLNNVGISEAKLGKVRYCLLFSYTFCEHFHDSSVHRGVNDRRFIGMVTNVRSLPNSLMWL
jgi:hypothetical protein